ncbi:MAG: GTPase HflX [Candidatus Thorarchaeota archaeon]
MRVLQDFEEDKKSHPKGDCILFLPRTTDNAHQLYLNRELRLLVKSANYRVISEHLLPVNDSNFYFSYFRLQEIKYDLEESLVPLNIIAGVHLSPKQHINLEQMFPYPISDKFELVLEIFEDRAMTEEAKLQIELAALRYESPRERVRLMHQLGLEGAWHTERSGFWSTGENPLNVLDASVAKKEALLRKRLVSLKMQRETKRRLRKRFHRDSLYCCLVGYTSAGKSTILNQLTGSTVSVSSRLFETLDTRVRSFNLDDLKVFVSDTIGFLEDLPTFLIDSFKSTLEEGLAADLLIMVMDGSDSAAVVQRKARLIDNTLNEIYPENKRIIVLNKIDLLEDSSEREPLKNRINVLETEFPGVQTVPLSATRDIKPLIEAIGQYRPKNLYRFRFPPHPKFRAFCHETISVQKELFFPEEWVMELSTRTPNKGIAQIQKKSKTLGIELHIEEISQVR